MAINGIDQKLLILLILSSLLIDNSQENLDLFNDDIMCSGKRFPTWDTCETFISKWAKYQGFRIIKGRIQRDDDAIRRRTFQCDCSRSYNSNSKKDTVSKKIQCPFLINTSCPKSKNPNSEIIINKIINQHNHPLDRSRIAFEDSKKFNSLMLEDIKFMTMFCKFGATAQRKFLEGKYLSHPIYSKDLYAAIQKFRPTSNSLSNDAAQISN